MNRKPLVFGTSIVALVASLSACNFPTGPTRGLTLEAVRQTMAAVTPLAASTAPATEAAGPAPSPVRIKHPFPITDAPGAAFNYTTRPGDTLEALALRFGVEPAQILGGSPLPAGGYVPIGLELQIPNVLEAMSPGGDLLPDGELVYSPTAKNFDLPSFVASADGYLSRYLETMEDDTVLSGTAIVQRVADENSLNPRLLLVLLEFRTAWVYGAPRNADATKYPIGFRISGRSGLYQELSVAATQLNLGYYGWRAGTVLETTYEDGGVVRWNPSLNAGSMALLRLFALLSGSDRWIDEMVGLQGFPARYETMFGDGWSRAQAASPILPSDLEQPLLELPFAPGEAWSLTAGPHNAWSYGTPRGALDLSPITGGDPCAVSARWVTASAPGVIVRAADNAVVLDLDGDGYESTGWTVLYYHLADDGMIAPGTQVAEGDLLGHPSCQGGRTTGKHVHLVRKYNGEWLAADGPVPLVLSGWQAVADERNYYGTLVRGNEVVTSDSSGRQGSTIRR